MVFTNKQRNDIKELLSSIISELMKDEKDWSSILDRRVELARRHLKYSSKTQDSLSHIGQALEQYIDILEQHEKIYERSMDSNKFQRAYYLHTQIAALAKGSGQQELAIKHQISANNIAGMSESGNPNLKKWPKLTSDSKACSNKR